MVPVWTSADAAKRPSDVVPIALDRVLVPLDAVPRPVRDEEVTVLRPERLGENWIGPILPFESMRRLGHAHQMRRHLGI
jgi:hypothetical protein